MLPTIMVMLTAPKGPCKTALWIPKNQKIAKSSIIKIIESGLATNEFNGALIASTKNWKIVPEGVKPNNTRTMNPSTKMMVTTNTGDKDWVTIGGTLSGSLIIKFFLERAA